MDQSIPERLTASLSDLGLPAPANVVQTMLMHDGYFVGWKICYDGGYFDCIRCENVVTSVSAYGNVNIEHHRGFCRVFSFFAGLPAIFEEYRR